MAEYMAQIGETTTGNSYIQVDGVRDVYAEQTTITLATGFQPGDRVKITVVKVEKDSSDK